MITTEEILEVTNNVFTTMLERPVELTDNPEDLADQSPITGCVHISGEWNGAVMLQTSGQLATYAASKMFAMDDADVQKNDLQDTMAELANMIGGNIKSLVPGPSLLSLPTVTTGKEFDIRIFGTKVDNSLPMGCVGQQLRVVICSGNNQEY